MRRASSFGAAVYVVGLTFCGSAAAATLSSSNLECAVDTNQVQLSWNIAFFAPIRGWVIQRDGERIAALGAEETGYRDVDVPDGEHTYVLSAIRTDGAVEALGRCRVVAGDFDLRCRVDGVRVHLSWGPVLIRVAFDRFLVRRDGEVIARLPRETLEFVDEAPGSGRHRYTVSAALAAAGALSEFLVGACTVRVPEAGLVCQVTPPQVHLDWSRVPLPEIVISHFQVVRDGEFIARVETNRFTDEPSPGEHHYVVTGVPGPGPEPLPGVPVILVGECRVFLPGDRLPPPAELRCTLLRIAPQPVPADAAVGIAQKPPPEDEVADAGWSVLLRWRNPVKYEQILVRRGGLEIARLAGDVTQFIDPVPTLQGRPVYDVLGVIGNRRSEAASCVVEIEPPVVPPPRDLRCEVVSVPEVADEPDVAVDPDVPPAVPVVQVSWLNPITYAALVLRRDGEVLARLRGNAMFHRDVAPPPGRHVYSLQGIAAGGGESVPARCEVVVGDVVVPPVADLTCVAVETNAGGPSAALRWRNPASYTSILILRDGGELAELPGDATSFVDRALEPAVYSYLVVARRGDASSRPAGCEVVIPGPSPRDLLFFSSGLFEVDDQGNAIPAAGGGDGAVTAMASNSAPLQGWSFGICHDPATLGVDDATIEGTTTATLNDGEGPSFLALGRFEGGITMAVIVDDQDLTGTLPPAADHRLLRLSYVSGPDARRGECFPVRYCSTLGDPPVAVVYVVRGFEVRPRSLPGQVCLPSPGFVRGDSNGDGEVDMSDAVTTLGWLFLGGRVPGCVEAADANGSGGVNIADPIYTLGWEFSGGPPPPFPFPECASAPLALGCDKPSCP